MLVSHGLPIRLTELIDPFETTVASLSAASKKFYVLIGKARFIWQLSEFKSTQHTQGTLSEDLIRRQNGLETNFMNWYAAVEHIGRFCARSGVKAEAIVILPLLLRIIITSSGCSHV